MLHEGKRKLYTATIVYWVLLLYIIVALGWWAFSLLHQNILIHDLKRDALQSSAPDYAQQVKKINEEQQRNVYKYVGEGSAFLLLIMVGAFYIYRSVRQHFQLQQQQQNFVMAVTHELKTPIAVSRLNLETLLRHQLEEHKKKKLLQMTLQETMRLDTLINNILISSQLEGHAYRVAKEELDLSALVNDLVKSFQARYPDRQIKALIDDGIEMEADQMLLKLLLSNLLENANKYSLKDKSIELKLYKKNDAVLLEVIDQGSGIPDEEKKAVFKKFYRMGNEQTRRTQGTGLGLYICKKIAEDHNGEIFVKDNHPPVGGSKFIVQFYT